MAEKAATGSGKIITVVSGVPKGTPFSISEWRKLNKVPLGTLGANGSSGNLALTAKFGLSWANAKTVFHELTLAFEIGR